MLEFTFPMYAYTGSIFSPSVLSRISVLFSKLAIIMLYTSCTITNFTYILKFSWDIIHMRARKPFT